MNKNFKPKNLLGQIKEKEAEDFFKNYYQDRGMLKWQGFFLSDHTAALSKKERLKKSSCRPQQTLTSIMELLMHSWQSRKDIVIQLNQIDTDQEITEFQGVIQGFDEKQVYLKINQRFQAIDISEIRNIHFIA
ncbi:MAG: hypothetical protein ABF483_05115 [Liquorilactobacillus nagelii]|jgi:hypothetical protein|uniref:DNA-directed RNA polymerase beta subunit n=1 Tax=Liquorilactobacillus nagelii TaxID=82688 RepID=A0A3S6R0Z8_9LACO|nr:hypothetical protein [Liquorilactobacillus nagelii]AUJ32185.1 hypothetical protein BSQ50_06225 [Liquorilactobacillus nagelii]KRL40907.1 hypothetical protein FD45_GL001557 [Liquorilactobacillus nagelii DSM 13675]MCC7615355.1 hypothetical protein [Liquorilactobacillus nagelii]MCP9315941.1 hypothetical protein [Liquorilactobacillus nagelii]QYH53868.1 hypothetical protein G6O73_03765 [Liquorilactobacillus nagelii DSM 13675]